MQPPTERKCFPTQAEVASAAAEFRRQTWAIAVVRRSNKILSDAAIWSRLGVEDQLRFAGSAENSRILSAIFNQVLGIDGYDILKIYGETQLTKPNEGAEAARFYAIKEDGLAWAEKLTAEQYAIFTRF